METFYAVVVDGIVENVVAWDGVSEWDQPTGDIVLIPEGEVANVGLGYSGGVFEQYPVD